MNSLANFRNEKLLTAKVTLIRNALGSAFKNNCEFSDMLASSNKDGMGNLNARFSVNID